MTVDAFIVELCLIRMVTNTFAVIFSELPVVAKLFIPSVRCPVCSHANDSDFRFCQRCGYR